jgi:hypothetical protein
VPYHIQGLLAQAGYVTLTDIAERFPDRFPRALIDFSKALVQVLRHEVIEERALLRHRHLEGLVDDDGFVPLELALERVRQFQPSAEDVKDVLRLE